MLFNSLNGLSLFNIKAKGKLLKHFFAECDKVEMLSNEQSMLKITLLAEEMIIF